ncbi:hypothetical protein Pelo_2337 [Pelomyxa schiedti]|nr:hypothetical protein Pelo_2337 [Pelomyxa schiedti]
MGTRHRKAPIDAVAIPTCAVEQRQDWLRCESRVNIHLVLAFELLGFKAVPIDGTFENNELALSVLSQMCSEEDKSNGVEDASHCRDLAPPLDKVEAKGVATNRPSPLALLTISRTSARLKCYGISLNKVFHHIGKAFKPDEQSTVMNFQKSVSHILEVFDTNVSLEASIAFSPLDIQLDLFQVTFGDCVKLGVVSKPESKIDSEVGNKGNTTHTLEAELKLTMGSVMGFIRNILLDQPSIADTLEVITQTKFLTLTETSLFHIIIKLDLGGGKGMVMEHFSLFVGPITLLGVPLNITTNLPTSSDQVNPRRSLSLALQKPILPLGEETTLLSIVSKLHALPPKIQDVLQKFVLKDYKLLLSLPVDSGGLSTLLELSFAFYINVSLRSRNAISCQACLLHNPLQTCVVVLFDNLELFTIISAIFGTSFGLPLRLYICQFLLLHQSTSATVPCSTPESFVTSFFSENEERQFQNMSGQQLALKQEERILLQKSCQKLLKRKEDTFLCLTISCYLTGQLFDMLHLEGTTLISLPELKLPGLDPGKASLLLSPGGVEIKTTLKFSHNLKLEASLKGSITSRSVRGRVTLDEDEKGEKPGIPLSLFIPGSLPFIKNLAVYGLQGEVGVSFPPLNVSILLGGGIRVLWEDGPKPFMEAVVRATVLVCAPPAISITTLYVACADITLGSLIRIVTGWSYKDVQLLDTIFPVVKELAFLCKVDDKELETVPSMPNTESAKQNSLVHVIQMFSERKKGSPLLLAHEQCLAFVAHLSWLGLEGKVVFFSKVGSTGAALLFQLMIENWECKVGSIVLFKLGHGSSGKGLDIKLLLDTKSRQASFDLEAYIEVLPGILGFTIQAEVHFGNGGRPGSVTSSGKKQDNGLHLEIAVKISFSRRENCEDNDMSPGNPSGLVLEGTLQVTWRKIVPDVRAAIRMSSRDGVISALVDGLKYCLTNFFNVCKGALQRAEDAVSKYVPRFVQGLLKGVLYVAKAVVNVVEQGFVAAILKLLNACAKVLDVKSLEVCGEVCGDDKSVVVMVKFELIVFGHVLQGSIQVNLKTLIIDLCKKVLQNIVLWWKDKNASEPVEKSEVPDDDWYRKECFFSDEDEELNVTSTTCEDAAYKTVALPPCSEYIGSPDDDESTIQLNSLINDVSRKVDLSSSMPPEDALDLTTASLSDPMLSEVPCITKPPIKCSLCSELVPTCIFSKHMRICRLTESPCLKCGEKVRLANKERHDTVDCPKKVLIPRHCEYCSEKVADGSKMHEHYSQFCEGDWTCPKCEKPMRRKAIVMHFLTSDVSVKCSNGGPDDICSKCNCYKESPHDCSVDKFCPYCEENQSTTNHICGEDHKERDCTGEVSCSYCGELLPASKEPARVKRSQHFAACKDAPAVCFYCTQLFHRSVISKHMENCKDSFLTSTTHGNNLQRLLPIEKKFLISKGKTATRRQNRLHKIALVNFLSEEMLQQDEGINLVQCPKCSETMGYSDLPVHLSCYCPRNLEKCPRQCGYTGPASNIIQHLTKQCYLSPGRCIRGDKCTLQVHFRVPPEEARLLYPDEPGTEIHKPGIFQYVVERIIPENSRRLSGIDPEEALYTTLCSRSVENGAPSCIHKRDETRHAIFCFNGIQECIFCHCPTSDLSQHILDCTEARRPIECDFCSVRVPVVEMPEHWLYSCGGKNFLVTCQDCGARVPFRSLEAHHLCSCPKSSLQCHLCGKHFNTEKYPRHMLKKCNGSLFTVKCGLCSQCCTTGELLNGTHYATKCSNCSWRCPLGAADEIETNACRKEVPLCKLEKHLIPDIGGDLCKSCKLPCPKYPACKAMVLRRDLTHHMEHECDYYTIPCPGCKGLIPKKNYALHERGCVFANEIEKECGDCHQIVKTASWNYHRAKTCEKRLVMAHSELDFQRHEPLQQEHIMRPLSGPHREQKESGLFSWFRSLLFGKASTTSTKKHCSLCNQDFSDQKATCPKVEALRCKTCGETDKTANGGPTVTKPCLRACSHCRAPEPQWKTTKCTHVVCKRCAEVVTVGGKGCLQQTFDQVRWEVREKGYFMNL